MQIYTFNIVIYNINYLVKEAQGLVQGQQHRHIIQYPLLFPTTGGKDKGQGY